MLEAPTATNDEDTSASSDRGVPAEDSGASAGSMPATSGVFDYCSWLVAKLTEEQRKRLANPFTYIDLCAGLGTSIIAAEALRRGLAQNSLKGGGECTCLTELQSDKRDALRRRLECVQGDAPQPCILEANADLVKTSITDDRGKPVEQPKADLLFLGIVCVDISGLSSTPKSLTNPEGSSGRSWLHCLDYLRSLEFERRPKAIVLECVENLDNVRTLRNGDKEKGTLIVEQALQKEGYAGGWVKISATRFYLPQKRPRAWGLFLQKKHHGPQGFEERAKDVAGAFEILRGSELPNHEPLTKILARAPEATAAATAAAAAEDAPTRQQSQKKRKNHTASRSGPEKWRKTHAEFAQKYKLDSDFTSKGETTFMKATAKLSILVPRAQAAVWLHMCKWRKKKLGRDWSWQDNLLVMDCGSSIHWMSVAEGMFPCIRPTNQYLILDHGEAKVADGNLCLALQGIGTKEAAAFKLGQESDSLKRDLAGNAFCANICCAMMVAALLTM